MGKKKGKKQDADKKAALQAKKEAKADKAARKRLEKAANKEKAAAGIDVTNDATGARDPEQQKLDELLKLYKAKDKQATESYEEELEVEFPPSRGNASLTLSEDSKVGDMYLFGGEYYDGIENIVLDHLLRWDSKNEKWKRVVTPAAATPSPRCAHSCVYYNKALYVFGGEMASADNYHHYKDVWRYDIPARSWTECVIGRTGSVPTPRSGHVAVMYKYFMIIFGGFYEALRDTPRWYNDVYVLNLQTMQWMDIPHSKLASRPEARSACNAAVVGDILMIHGGYSKLGSGTTANPQQESKVHTDTWFLHLKPLLQGKPPNWEKVAGSSTTIRSNNPSGRAGTTAITYKQRMLVYGGVIDHELLHHKVESVFYNDLFAFDFERRKWFPIHVRKSNTGKRRKSSGVKPDDTTTTTDEEDVGVNPDNNPPQQIENSDNGNGSDGYSSDLEEETADGEANDNAGWDLDMLRSTMFAFIDGDGNIVYEKIEEDEDEKDEGEGQANKTKEQKAETVFYNDNEDEEVKVEDEDDDEEMKVEDDDDDDEEMKVDDDDDGIEQIPETKPTQLEPSKHQSKKKNKKGGNIGAPDGSRAVKEADMADLIARTEPLPRINAELVVRGHKLYVYGGLLEVGDREVTLDDMWCFDLRKRDKWECLWPGTMHKQVWRGAVHDDDDSYVSESKGEDADYYDDDDDDDDDENDFTAGPMDDSKEKKKSRKANKAGIKEEIKELNAKYDLGNDNRTPRPGEKMAEFYSRTNAYWNEQAMQMVKEKMENNNDNNNNSELMGNKELKREGFSLAKTRFQELEPILERLTELDLEHKQAKQHREDKKKSKEDKSSSKQKKKKSNRGR